MKKQTERVSCSGRQRGFNRVAPSQGRPDLKASAMLWRTRGDSATRDKTGLRGSYQHWPYLKPRIGIFTNKKRKKFDAMQKPAYNHLIGW
jgi:hypothetical protein